MTILSKKQACIGTLTALIAIVGIFGWSPMANADTNQAASSQTADPSAFCAKIDSATAEIDQLLSASETHYMDSAAANKQSLADARSESDKELRDARAAADQSYAEQFKAIADQATTKAEKKAVAAFQTSVTASVTLRRNTVDQAIETYREGIDQIVQIRQATYSSAFNTLKSSVDATLADAKTDCSQTGGAGKDSQANAPAQISAARAQFAAAVSALEKNTADADTLASDRDAKVTAAGTAFQAAIDAAGAKLKTALGQN